DIIDLPEVTSLSIRFSSLSISSSYWLIVLELVEQQFFTVPQPSQLHPVPHLHTDSVVDVPQQLPLAIAEGQLCKELVKTGRSRCSGSVGIID
ncbi:4591_t:CDS:2, partial [Racocetra fulgida]